VKDKGVLGKILF